MNTRLVSLSLLVLVLSVPGCAVAPKPPPTLEDTSFFLARYDNVWEKSLKVLEREGLPVKEADKATGLIITKFVNYSVGMRAHQEIEDIAERPDIRLALFSQVGYSLSIRIAPAGDMSSQLTITSRIEAYDKNATQKWHPCRSRNVVERKMLEKIRAVL